MPYTPILATLGYVLSEDRRQVLMLHRKSRAGDHHWGKFVGLGGKLEVREDPVACMIREIKEEADIDVQEPILEGTVSWPGFGKGGEDWFAFVFTATRFTGTPQSTSAEGELLWVPVEDVLALRVPMWEGDIHFLNLLLKDRPASQWHAVMPYRDGRPESFHYSIVKTRS